MKVVIGTRRWLGSEWTHVDIDPTPLLDKNGRSHPVDVVSDARQIKLADGCAEHVYSQECLEHFPFREGKAVLTEWCRLVARGGTILVEVPDFLAACRQVLDTDTLECDWAIQQIVFGGQANEFDVHYTGWTPRMLTTTLESLGMVVESVRRGWEAGYLQVGARRG